MMGSRTAVYTALFRSFSSRAASLDDFFSSLLGNPGTNPLAFLCIVSPPWRAEDDVCLE